jgi:hypothetical protein
MPTIAAGKVQSGTGVAVADFNIARTANAASVDTNPLGNKANNVQYFKSSGRGGGTLRFKRTFAYFDVSGVTDTVASATIRVTGYSGAGTADADTLFVVSTAFGGDGSSNLTTAEFNDIDYTKSRTAVINAADYDTDGTNDYTVNADGLAQIKTDNALILALIEEDADLNNTEGSDAARDIPINFGVNFTLSYVLASTGYAHDVSGLAAASIAEVNTVATANIAKINNI